MKLKRKPVDYVLYCAAAPNGYPFHDTFHWTMSGARRLRDERRLIAPVIAVRVTERARKARKP